MQMEASVIQDFQKTCCKILEKIMEKPGMNMGKTQYGAAQGRQRQVHSLFGSVYAFKIT